MAEDNLFKRTVGVGEESIDVARLNGAVLLEGRFNVDMHYILDDLQNLANAVYEGRQVPGTRQLTQDLLNSVDEQLKDPLTRAINDLYKRYENGVDSTQRENLEISRHPNEYTFQK